MEAKVKTTNIFERLLEKQKWEERNQPLEQRLKRYKRKKKVRESILYRYDCDVYIKGYDLDDTYKCSIILRRDLDGDGRLLWSCIDRIHDDFINTATCWEYSFTREFIDKVLTIPTADNDKLWLLDAGHNLGIHIKIMRQIVREMKEYCKENNILIRSSYY